MPRLNTGKKIMKLRKAMGLSRRTLAERIMVSDKTITRVELTSRASIRLLAMIANELNVSLNQLIY